MPPELPIANAPARAGADAADVVVDVSGLRMSYDGFEAVRGVDLRVSRGEIFAFLGPNGAGKTTTVEILEGHRSVQEVIELVGLKRRSEIVTPVVIDALPARPDPVHRYQHR